MAAADCLKAIRDAGPDLTDEEIELILEDLAFIREGRGAKDSLFTLEEELLNAADELATETTEAAIIAKRNRLINILRQNDLVRLVDLADAATGDPSLGLRAAMTGVNARFPGARDSVAARAHALQGEYLGGMIAELDSQGLLALLNGRQLDREIAQELARITLPDTPGSKSPEAKKIAAVIDKYRRVALARENRAGAWIKPLPGYIVRQSHDMHVIRRAGFREWKAFIETRLDARTFEGADPEKFLRSAFDAIQSGRHLKSNGEGETDLAVAFRGPGNLAKRVSEHRVLHFKDADAWFDYNERFGQKSFTESLIADFSRAAQNTALMEMFGTNPRNLFEGFLIKLQDRFRDDPKKLGRLNERAIRNQFDEIEGLTRIPVSPSVANFGAITRAGLNMAKLGGSAISSIVDVATKAVEIRRQTGTSLFDVWAKNLASTLEGMAPGQRRITADLIGVGLEGHTGDLAARFSATDNLPGSMAKLQRLFFKLNLLAPWTDSNKRGLGLMMARDLGMQRRVSWDDLAQRRILELYGFDEAKWNIVREAVGTLDDGRDYLMPDAIRDLSDEVIGATGRKGRALRDELETALRSYYVDRAEIAIPTPGARERALLLQGTQPGTPLGEAVRFVAQFKGFPTAVLTRVWGGLAEADTTSQFFRNMVNGRGDRLGLVHMIVATTLLGYLAQSAKQLVRGKSPRDPASVETWVSAMAQGGGAGIYGDFLFGEFNRFGRTAVETAAGPALAEIGGFIELMAGLRDGDDVAARAFNTLINDLPFVNLFYTRLALDYLFLFQIQESLNPGYLTRMERRIAKDQGQVFLLPPSRAVN